MKFFLRIFKRAIFIHKYPRYVTDIYVHTFLRSYWRLQGMEYGKGTSWLGKPIISLVISSTIVLGEKCLLCSRSGQTDLGVNHPVILRTLSKTAELRIGSNVRMSGTTICAAKNLKIGNRCITGANVTISDTDFHSLDPQIRSSLDDSLRASNKPVLIGDDVFIGGGSTILKGVSIGNGAIVGAGSVVTKDVSSITIVAGNPAKIIRSHLKNPFVEG